MKQENKISEKELTKHREIGLGIKFQNIQDVIKFLQHDFKDTFETLKSDKWNNLTKVEKRGLKEPQIFLENKNVALSVLLSLHDCAINQLQEFIENCKKDANDVKLFELCDIIK